MVIGTDQQTYQIIGAAMEVHRSLGCGFLEAPYREALELEFEDRGIDYRCEVKFPIGYKGRLLKRFYRADFVCYERVIVEAKAIRRITNLEEAQINYLKASGLHKALLLNFGNTSLEYRRFLNGTPR
jgi:GxxExxY protein